MNLDEALHQFDVVEANLAKLEATWDTMQGFIPSGIAFTGSSPEGREYRQLQRAFEQLLCGLPPIDGWRITALPLDLDSIAQMRFDADEIDEPAARMTVEHAVEEPSGQIEEYRFRMTRSRRKLVRARLEELVTAGDAILVGLGAGGTTHQATASVRGPAWQGLETVVAEIDRLLGSGTRSAHWQNLRRHLSFALGCDLLDIRERDWPAVKADVAQRAFDHSEPIPVHVPDLGVLVAAAPSGRASTALNWATLNDEGFERLVFALLGDAQGYENPEWLMRTRAPDRGRDLSVVRVRQDALSGASRERVIIQCKHWLSKSIADTDVSDALTKMTHWEWPPIDVLIVATSGRFTADAVRWVEQRSHAGKRPRVELWPESHLETLLAQRSHLVAMFNLR